MKRTCRHCKTPLRRKILDLGHAPPSNAYLSEADLSRPELTFPLRIFFCDACLLVQTEDFTDAEDLFSAEYAYLSSTSALWLEHARTYVHAIRDRLSLDAGSFAVEIASNDGYLLSNFIELGIPCLGVEPTDSTADKAETKGIEVLREFFGAGLGASLSEAGKAADLVIGNNVYAHVPDINDFTRGIQALLKPEGVVTLEFPHVMRLLEYRQFDTVYHEHFSYLSLGSVRTIFESNGLRIFDVEELPTHGGSLRIYGCRREAAHATLPSVNAVLDAETAFGLRDADTYTSLQGHADEAKNALLSFLLECRLKRRSVAGYGAAAKGNTLLNYAGVRPDLLPFVCDAAESKQGNFLPGSHIPILDPQVLLTDPPDYVLILPWNIAPEIETALSELRRRGTSFVTAIPELRVR